MKKIKKINWNQYKMNLQYSSLTIRQILESPVMKLQVTDTEIEVNQTRRKSGFFEVTN